MRRKSNSGQSQSKYMLSENEKLKYELAAIKEEQMALKVSTDHLTN